MAYFKIIHIILFVEHLSFQDIVLQVPSRFQVFALKSSLKSSYVPKSRQEFSPVLSQVPSQDKIQEVSKNYNTCILHAAEQKHTVA